MPRQRRVVIPHYPHHITQRGNNRRDIFFAESDQERRFQLIKAASGGGIDLGQGTEIPTTVAESQAANAAITVVGLGLGAQGESKGLPDNAFVVRGGLNKPENFVNGSGVSIDANRSLQGVSVNSAAGKSVADLSRGNPNNRVGVTTVGDVSAAGGDVTASPTAGNPNHCTIFGVSPQEASDLMRVLPNPARQQGQQ